MLEQSVVLTCERDAYQASQSEGTRSVSCKTRLAELVHAHVVVRNGSSGKEFGRSVRGLMVWKVGIPTPSGGRSGAPFQ